MKKIVLFTFTALFISLSAFARQPQKGYRGFIDWTNDVRSEGIGFTNFNFEKTLVCYTGLSTSHGYQFNDWLFTGLGLNFQYNSTIKSHIIAPFFQGRTDLKFGKFTPFGDLRLGFSCTSGGGVYFSPNIGYRFNWGRKAGLNVGVGTTLIGSKIDIYEVTLNPDSGYHEFHYSGREKRSTVYFSFKVGIDF